MSRKTKSIKKLLAVVLAFSMCMSFISVPAFAVEGIESDTSPPAGNVLESNAPAEGTPGLSVEVEVTGPAETPNEATGGTTTTTTTETTWTSETEAEADADVDADTESDNDVDADVEGDADADTDVEVDADADTDTGSDADADVDTDADVDVGNEPEVDVDTKIEGSETKSETVVTDEQGRVVEESGSLEGQEKTETTTTETEVTITENELITDEGELREENYEAGEVLEESMAQLPEDAYDSAGENLGKWSEVDQTQESWISDGYKEGNFGESKVKQEYTEVTEEDNPEYTDPLAGNVKVELNMTPNGTDKDSVDVTSKIFIDANSNLFDRNVINKLESENDGKYEISSGNVKEIYEAIKGSDGKISGYTKTTVTTSYAPTQEGEAHSQDNEDSREIYNVVNSEPVLPENIIKNDDGSFTNTDDKEYVDSETGENVKVETVVNPIYEDGVVIGYEVRKVTTRWGQNITDIDDAEAGESFDTPGDNDGYAEFILPEKPESSVANNPETGNVTTVTVENIYGADGVTVLGYKSVTTVTDANGVVLSTASNSIYGTSRTVSHNINTNPTGQTITTDKEVITTEITRIMGTTEYSNINVDFVRTDTTDVTETSETEYKFIELEDGTLAFEYEGKMYAVQSLAGNGIQQTNIYTPIDLNKYKNAEGINTSESGEYNSDIPNSGFYYSGRGLVGIYKIYDSKGESHSSRLYAMRDSGGNLYYAYCSELDANIYSEVKYNKTDIDNNSSVNLFKDGSTATKQLNNIAVNAFWGTSEGLGSLQAVKDFLARNGHTDVANSLNAGEAIAASQAAMWAYGRDSNSDQIITDPNNKNYYLKGVTDSQARTNIETLRSLLLSVAADAEKSKVETIDANDIVASAIVLDSKTDKSYQGKDVYTGSVGFTLDVSTSSINGDLIVTVDTGVGTKTVRLAGSNKAGQNYGTIHPDNNGNYVIKDLELADGVKIDLTISGTQHIADNVFVYADVNNHKNYWSDSQNMLGISKTTNKVNLSVELEFNVNKPDVAAKTASESSERNRIDTETYNKTEVRTDERDNTYTTSAIGEKTTQWENTKVYADITVTEVTVDETKAERDWSSSYENTWEYPEEPTVPETPLVETPGGNTPGGDTPSGDTPDTPSVDIPEEDVPLVDVPEEDVPLVDIPEEDVPLVDIPEEDVPLVDIPEEDVPLVDIPEEDVPLVDIPEEDVPLAEIPETSDISVLWYIMTLLSGIALVALFIFERRKNNSEQ